MRLTVAGANSFIGKRLLALAENQDNIEITAVIRRGSLVDFSKNKKCTKIVECDMEDYGNLGMIAGEGDCFIDLTWEGSRGINRQNSTMQKLNYEGNIAAMKSMADVGYTTLVSAGSQAEYGLCSSFITEETPLNPNTEYGKYKVQIFHETTALCKKYGIRFIEPRYFSLYGPGDYEKTLIVDCIIKMLKNEVCELNECTQLWDYLYIDDAIEALLLLCNSKSASGPYNFATGEYQMIRNFVMDIHRAINSKSRVRFGSPESAYKGLIINLQPKIDRLKKEINWFPRTSFINGIKKTAESLKK